MGVVFKKNNFLSFASEISLRFDYLFNNYVTQISGDYYTYKELFEIVEYSKVDISKLSTFKYAEIGNVEKTGEVNPVTLSINHRNELNESLFKKIEKGDIIKPKKGDILISKIRPYLNKNVLIDDREIYFTKAFIQIRPKIDSLIFYHTLRSILFKNLNAVSRQGKGYPTLKEDDLKIIRFPKRIIDAIINNQVDLVNKIISIEEEIKQLKKSKKDVLSIINEVFADYYNYSRELWKEFGKGMTAGTQKSYPKTFKTYKMPFSQIEKSKTLRVSSRFHNPITQKLTDILLTKPVTTVEKIIKEIVKGVQPKYNNEGTVPVIKIASLKNDYIDLDNTELVTQSFINNLKENQKARKNDIILCCTGKVSLGKIDIYEDKEKAVLSVDNYLIRLKENIYDIYFFTYFFRSILGAYQIERDYTGATNQIHLYDKQIKSFNIPDIPLKEQTKIVVKIKSRIDAQKEIDKQIKEKQNEISELLENTIKEYTNV